MCICGGGVLHACACHMRVHLLHVCLCACVCVCVWWAGRRALQLVLDALLLSCAGGSRCVGCTCAPSPPSPALLSTAAPCMQRNRALCTHARSLPAQWPACRIALPHVKSSCVRRTTQAVAADVWRHASSSTCECVDVLACVRGCVHSQRCSPQPHHLRRPPLPHRAEVGPLEAAACLGWTRAQSSSSRRACPPCLPRLTCPPCLTCWARRRRRSRSRRRRQPQAQAKVKAKAHDPAAGSSPRQSALHWRQARHQRPRCARACERACACTCM